jgi:F-box-like
MWRSHGVGLLSSEAKIASKSPHTPKLQLQVSRVIPGFVQNFRLTIHSFSITGWIMEPVRTNADLDDPAAVLPTEMMQNILEEACSGFAAGEREHTILSVSQVNKNWRKIALRSPRLWTEHAVKLWRGPQQIADYWSWTIPRLRSIPVEVRIYGDNADPRHRSRLNLCPLYKIRAFKLLLLQVDMHTRLVPIKSNIELLDLSEIASSNATASDIFTSFPAVQELRVKHFNAESRTISVPVSLASFTSHQIRSQAEHQALAHYSKLEALVINDAWIYATTPITLLSLTSLTVREDSFRILNSLTCPRLRHLGYFWDTDDHIDDLVSFLERHPNITKIQVTNGDKIELWAARVPDLRHLWTHRVARPFFELEDGALGKPLLCPSLSRLEVEDPGLEDFETLVRFRCLPTNHPFRRSMAATPVIATLIIHQSQVIQSSEARAGHWDSSPLLADTVLSDIICDGKARLLSWVG